MRRFRLADLCCVFLLAVAGCRGDAPPICKKPMTPGPNIFFIVIDTVRSDHTSLCGFDKPTTPNLTRLAKQQGAHYTCDAIAPASWTFPSHASFFTGKDPIGHGAHSLIRGLTTVEGWGSHNRRLKKKHQTLAEKMNKKGYQSAIYSTNPVVSDGLGLTRGFQRKKIATTFGQLFRKKCLAGLEKFTKEIPRDRPLFMFINIADAHQPWLKVPEGVPWAAPSGPVKYHKAMESDPWRRFVEDRMDEEEREAYRDKVENAYTYAVSMADENLGRVVRFLRKDGWCDRGCRFIVTSDHGEFLGEHGLLDHGNYVWEPLVRVPFLVWGEADVEALPNRLSATAAFPLSLTGRLPRKPIPVTSMAWPHMRRCAHTNGKAFCSISAALWEGQEKLLFMDEKYYRIDLTRNPGETDLKEIDHHPRLAELKDIARRMVAQKRDDKTPDFEVMEKLRALGYMD